MTAAQRPGSGVKGSKKPAPAYRPLEPDDGWRMPSGEDLISFALNAGLVASPLLAEVTSAPEETEMEHRESQR